MSTSDSPALPASGNHVAFVGAGPRAVSALERLLAHYEAAEGSLGPLRITLVDPYEVGSGRVWRSGQSPLLLNNSAAADTTLFAQEDAPLLVSARTGPSSYDWARNVVDVTWPSWVQAEAAALRPWTQPTRSLLGEYFRWVFRHICSDLPAGVSVHELRDAVIDVTDQGGTPGDEPGQLVVLASGAALQVDAVVFVQGFLPNRPRAHERRRRALRAGRPLHRVRAGMASEVDFSGIPAGKDVLVRGLGATFFDVVGLLYEGRGGRYASHGRTLAYEPSGREPRLLVGSRQGLPKRAQHPGPVPRPRLTHLNDDTVDRLITAHGAQHDLSFAGKVWPLIEADLSAVFDAAQTDASDLDLAGWNSFSWQALTAPQHGVHFESFVEWQDFTERYLRRELAGATGGASPWLAARAAVLAVRAHVLTLDVAGVFAPPEQGARRLSEFYRGASQVTSGPPASRFLEFTALVNQGFITLIGPRIDIEVTDEQFTARSSAFTGRLWRSDVLVDALLEFGNLAHAEDRLVGTLLRNGLARLAESGATDVHAHGTSFDLDPETFALRDRSGFASTKRFVLGMPGNAVQRSVGQVGTPVATDPFFVDADRVAASVIAGLRAPISI